MSIEKDSRMFIPVCDICGEELPPEYNFYDAVDAKKRAGWKSRKTSGEWEDVCTSCQEYVKLKSEIKSSCGAYSCQKR